MNGEPRFEPVDGTERVLLRWSGQHRQHRLRAGDEACRSQSKEQPFVGNPRGGRTAAILASLTSTCRRHDVDPQLYLTQLLIDLSQVRKRDCPTDSPTSETAPSDTRALRNLHFTKPSPCISNNDGIS